MKVHETDDDDDHDIHDHHADKEIYNNKWTCYKGLYVRNYENQIFLDISIKNTTHKFTKSFKNMNYQKKKLKIFSMNI